MDHPAFTSPSTIERKIAPPLYINRPKDVNHPVFGSTGSSRNYHPPEATSSTPVFFTASKYGGGDGDSVAQGFRREAVRGTASAQFTLAGYYLEGFHRCKKDLSEAFHWFYMAALQGHAEAQYLLGDALHFGQGVAKNDPLAAHWYRQSSAQGFVKGTNALSTYNLERVNSVVVSDIPSMMAVAFYNKS